MKVAQVPKRGTPFRTGGVMPSDDAAVKLELAVEAMVGNHIAASLR